MEISADTENCSHKITELSGSMRGELMKVADGCEAAIKLVNDNFEKSYNELEVY